MARSPHTIFLEFSRAADAGDEHGFRFEAQDYVRRDEDGSVENATFPWSEKVLADLTALQRAKPDRAAAQRLGDTLRSFLGKLSWKAFEDQIVQALDGGRAVHVTVRSSAAELYALPFELVTLRATGQHLGELPGCLFRYEWPATRTAPPVPDPPLEGGRIVFAWSAAGGAVPARAHLAALKKGCAAGHHVFDDQRDVVSAVTRDALSAALSDKSDPVRVLHVLCHGGAADSIGYADAGAPDSATPSFGLVWNGAEGEGPDVIDAASLRQLLAPHVGSLRLVVLCACHGGSTGALGNHLGSLAQMLHRIGIPAIVASRYPLSVDGSTTLTETLYERLLVGLTSLEDAVLAARARLAERTDLFDWASLQLYARSGDGPEHRPFAIRPYRGLAAFRPGDRRFFFGREEEVARLLALLSGGKRLVTVVGASGSGKSSLVLAGLVPKIEDGALGEGVWRVRILRPGAAPCRALSAAISTLDSEVEPHQTLESTLMDNPRARRTQAPPPASRAGAQEDEVTKELVRDREALATRASQALGGKAGTGRLLLVVDQFEEVFTQGEQTQSHAFIDNLLHATEAPGVRVHTVLTLRGDFYGHCLDQRALAERITESQVIAFPMKADQIRAAIERPAELVGLQFDGGIVDALVDALREGALGGTMSGGPSTTLSSSNLPLLQFALEELWKRRKDDRIVWGAWKQIGGVRGALAQRADEVLDEFPNEDDRALIRHMFGRLVQLGDGTVDTRRYAARDELEGIRPGRAGDVLDRWIDARLLVTDHSLDDVVQVGVAHEALIREWHTLRRWIHDSRNALRRRQELSHQADLWKLHDRSPDDVWRGGRLRAMLEILEEHDLPLSELEAEFLAASKAQEDEKRRAEEEQRQRELEAEKERARNAEKLAETAQQLAASQRKTIRIGAALMALVVAAGGAALYFARWAYQEKEKAEQAEIDEQKAKDQKIIEAERAHDAAQIAAARSAIINDPTTAICLLRDLRKPEEHAGWVETALEALWRPQSQLVLHHDLALTAAAFSPDGARVLTASEDGRVKIWSVGDEAGAMANGDKPIAICSSLDPGTRGPQGRPEPVLHAAWSPNGKRVLAVTHGGSVLIWPSTCDAKPVVIRHDGGVRVRAAAWSPDGERILTVARGDYVARVVLAEGKTIAMLPHPAEIAAFAWSPDKEGAHIATAAADGVARVWPADGKGDPVLLKGHKAALLGVSWSPDGKRVATASADRTARIWPADGKGREVVLTGHEDAVVSAAFSRDGQRVVTASRDKVVRVWRSDGKDKKGKEVVLTGHQGVLIDASFSKDGKRILSTSDGQTPRLWNSDGSGGEMELRGHNGSIVAASWDPEGHRIVTASTDKTARIWDPDKIDALKIMNRYDAAVTTASWSPDGQQILAVLADGTAHVSPAGGAGSSAPAAEKILRDKGRILIASWSRGDGAPVLTAGEKGAATIWPSTGDAVALEGHTQSINAAVWSPDGKRAATASDDGSARLWDASGKAGPTLTHGARVTIAAFRPKGGDELLTGSDDGTARVWAVDGKEICAMQHGSPVRAASWSDDGQWIVTASDKDDVRVWTSGCAPFGRAIEEPTTRIIDAFFSADGKRVVTASDENTVRLWPIAATQPMRPGQRQPPAPLVLVGVSAALTTPEGQSRELVLTRPRSFPLTARIYFADSDKEPIQLRGHEDTVRSAVWSADGKRVLTGADDGTARIWLFDQKLLRKAMCKMTQAHLNEDELHELLGSSAEQGEKPENPCLDEDR